MRIAVAGFLHETNTFAPSKADYDAFVQGGGWPALTRGPAVLEATRNVNIGMCGFIAEAETLGFELLPALWCAASPSAHVTRAAYERIVGDLLASMTSAGP